MKIFIACDHAAYQEKELLKEYLSQSHDIVDLGTNSTDSVHYPDYGKSLAQKVLEEKEIGIALCGSGIGISIAVNRFKGIRGALCRDTEDAKMSRLHNNANILCLGARRNTIEEIKNITDVWLSTEFEGGRHQTRTELLDK